MRERIVVPPHPNDFSAMRGCGIFQVGRRMEFKTCLAVLFARSPFRDLCESSEVRNGCPGGTFESSPAIYRRVLPTNARPVPEGRLKPGVTSQIKRPDGTQPLSSADPAINRRATFGHSYGMGKFKNTTFAEVS